MALGATSGRSASLWHRWVVLPWLILAATAAADSTVWPAAEYGAPAVQVYTPQQYQAQGQNWAIVSDAEGRIYVGNNLGVLVYDGVSWTLVPVDNRTAVRSLSLDPHDGSVWVGAQGDFGRLEQEADGTWRFRSERARLPDDAPEFRDVWHLGVLPEAVLIFSDEALFAYPRVGPVRVLKPAGAFFLGFQAGTRYFVHERGVGLKQYRDGALQALPGVEALREARIYAVLERPPPASDLLLFTREQGALRYHDGRLTSFGEGLAARFAADLVYTGAVLPDGAIAVGTLLRGLLLLDRNGSVRQAIGIGDGLPDPGVKAVTLDGQGGLWLALGHGLARVDLKAPTRYARDRGLEGSVYAVHRHAGTLWAGTSVGLYRLRAGPEARFEAMPGLRGQTWALASVGEDLLIGAYEGLFRPGGGQVEPVLALDNALSLLALDRDRVLVGWMRGLRLIERDGTTWRDRGPVPGIEDQVRSLVRGADGSVWIGTWTQGVLRLPAVTDADPSAWPPPVVIGGLPSTVENWPLRIEQEVLIGSEGGLYRPSGAGVELDPRWAAIPELLGLGVSMAVPSGDGLWLNVRAPAAAQQRLLHVRGFGAAAQVDGDRAWSVPGPSGGGADRLRIDPDGTLWVAADEGLWRVPPAASGPTGSWQLLWRGLVGADGARLRPSAAPLRLRYEQAARVRVEVAATHHGAPVQYAFWLEGNDAEWSPWRDEPFADYGNLWEGRYRLHLRARAADGSSAVLAPLPIAVAPPWYRSTIALLLWAALAVLAVWVLTRWRVRRLKAQRRALEERVAERTRELKVLGEMGREITATLDLDRALDQIYAQVTRTLPADIFAIGIVVAERQAIDFHLVIENGQRLAPYERPLSDANQLPVWCVTHGEPILIGDYPSEYRRYLAQHDERLRHPAGGPVRSLLYVPIRVRAEVIGVLAVGCRVAHAYHAEHQRLLEGLAAYAAIAIDNGRAHSALARSLEALEASKRALVRSEKLAALGQLVVGVAHEVNTPLGIALTASSHLTQEFEQIERALGERRLGQRRLAEFLDAGRHGTALVQAGLRRAAALVDGFRQLAAARELGPRERVDLGDALGADLARWQAEAGAAGIGLRHRILAAGPVVADPTALRQIVEILVQNALRHAFVEFEADDPTVELRVELVGEQLVLTCRDNGRGIALEAQERVFEPFYTTARAAGAIGLGLHVLHLVVERLGGRVELHSAPGRGTEVRVWLPVRGLDPDRTAPERATASP